MANQRSFENVTNWMKDIKEHANQNKATILVGTKADQVESREVSRDEAEKFALSNELTYFEVSALTGDGIDEMMN